MSSTERDIRMTEMDIQETKSKISKIKQNIKAEIKKYNCLPQVNSYINTPSFTKRGLERFRSFINELQEDLEYDRDGVYDPDNVDPDEIKYLDNLYCKSDRLLYYLENSDDLNKKLEDLKYRLYLENFRY
jgi:hypothetical protein